VLESECDAFYETFVGVVARGRKRSVEEIEKLAQGRIYSGIEAHARGLVDELGGLDQALERAADLAGHRHLDPVVIRPPSFSIPPPPPQHRAAEAMLTAFGFERIVGERVKLGLNLSQNERVLLYEPLGSDGRTWFDVT
jgi:protease-4